MEAQGPDVDHAIDRRRGIFIGTYNFLKSVADGRVPLLYII